MLAIALFPLPLPLPQCNGLFILWYTVRYREYTLLDTNLLSLLYALSSHVVPCVSLLFFRLFSAFRAILCASVSFVFFIWCPFQASGTVSSKAIVAGPPDPLNRS